MTFAKKLDFLMNITKTSNSSLALATILDASYISRLRTGKRLMPKDEHILESMATFLAHQFKEDLQKKLLQEILNIESLPKEVDLLASRIEYWLASDIEINSSLSDKFFSTPQLNLNGAEMRVQSESTNLDLSGEAVSIYYGVEGKRAAAETFLQEVLACDKAQTLLLYSDEDTSWMTEPKYARKWAELMKNVIARGNKIKIIHTISRNLDEMLSAITQWMPLYMSGLIEPYYYPKKRDGIFKRTLFIASNTAALISNSIGEQFLSAANVIYRDKEAVCAFAEEFSQYLNLCRPLMRIFTAKEKNQCRIMFDEFESSRANSMIKTESLSLLTMPRQVLMQIIGRFENDEYDVASSHDVRYKYFLDTLASNRFTEIICLPDIEDVKNGKVKISMSNIINKESLYYTKDEFAEHLQNIVMLLETYENYHVKLMDSKEKDPYTIYIKEEFGVIIAKNFGPQMVLAIKEDNIIATFWDSINNRIIEKNKQNSEKAEAISELKRYALILSD